MPANQVAHFQVAKAYGEFRSIARTAVLTNGLTEAEDYTAGFSTYFHKLSTTGWSALDKKEKASLLETINAHTNFIKNLAALHTAVNDPKNDPTKLAVVMNDKKVMEFAVDFIPTMQNLITQACSALDVEKFAPQDASHLKAISFLSNVVEHATALVKDKSKTPATIQPLLNDIKLTKQSSFSKFLQKHHNFAEVTSAVLLAAGMAFVFCGAIISALTLPVGGPVVGLPMIAIGAVLCGLGGKMAQTVGVTLNFSSRGAPRYQDQDNGMFIPAARKAKLGDISDSLKKLVTAKQTVDAFTKAEDALAKANKALPKLTRSNSFSVFKTPSAAVVGGAPEPEPKGHRRSKSR